MWVNFSVLGSKRVSPPVDQIEPSGCTLIVCFRQSSWYSVILPVFGSHLPSRLVPASASQTLPSLSGTAEWISAGSLCGVCHSTNSPVLGLKRENLLEMPYCGVKKLPSLSGCATHGKRVGPG